MADIDKARTCLGYGPELSVSEGLKRAGAWYVNKFSSSPVD
jgi:nucleoside-diphosphate-sugar epimerase